MSALGTVHGFAVRYCGVEDVSALGSVHSLNISNCSNIDDVSALVDSVWSLTLLNAVSKEHFFQASSTCYVYTCSY